MTTHITDIKREDWCKALSEVPRSELVKLVEAFPDEWRIEPLAVPQSGLGMLKMQDSTLGDSYYLGEFPLSSCWIKIITPDQSAEGAALVMDDDVEQAKRLAVCDAVLSAQLPGWEGVRVAVEKGTQKIREKAIERKSYLARTKVDFSLMEDVGDDI